MEDTETKKLDPNNPGHWKKSSAEFSGAFGEMIDNVTGVGGDDKEDVGIDANEAEKEKLSSLVRENSEIESMLINETKNEESGVSSYEKASTKDKILMILGKKANQSRKRYIEKDYEMDKKLGGIKRFFGKIIKTEKYEEEIISYKNEYEKDREDCMGAILELEGITDKNEAEIITRDFQINEHLRGRNDRLDVAMENNPVFEKFKKYSLGMVNKYRKLRSIPAEKISKLTGSKIAGIGAGVAVVGGAMRITGLGVNIPWKIFSVTVATIGYKQMLESIAEKSRLKKGEKEIESATELFERDYDKFNDWLTNKNKNLNKDIQDEKYWKNWRTIMAGGAATATMFGGSWLGGKAAEYFSNTDIEDTNVINENKPVSGADKDSIVNTEVGLNETNIEDGNVNGEAVHVSPSSIVEKSEDNITQDIKSENSQIVEGEDLSAFAPPDDNFGNEESNVASDKLDSIAKESSVGVELNEAGTGAKLTIDSGSSMKDTLTKFLENNSEKFTEGGMGFNESEIGEGKRFESVKDWAEKRAIGIVGEFTEGKDYNYNKVSVGTSMDINFSNPADIKIEGIKDPYELGASKDVEVIANDNSEIKPEDLGVKQEHSVEDYKEHGASIFESDDVKNLKSVDEVLDEEGGEGSVEDLPSVNEVLGGESQEQIVLDDSLSRHEMAIAYKLGIDSDHYAEINNMSVEEIIEEVKKSGNLEYGADRYDVDLPDGDYAGSGGLENRRLGVIMDYLIENEKIEDSGQSISEVLRNLKDEDFQSAISNYENTFGVLSESSQELGEGYGEYIGSVIQRDLREIIQSGTGEGRIIRELGGIRGESMANVGENELLNSFKEAVNGSIGNIEHGNNETVGRYILKALRKAYELGEVDKFREAIANIENK